MAQITQYYNYLTDQGVIVPDTAVVLSEIERQMEELFGGDLDTSPETPQGRLIEMWQRSRTFTIQAMAAISNMLNLNKANGFVLDDLGALFLISRQPATYTTTTVVLGGVPGTVVPAGTRFQNTDGQVFQLMGNYTLGGSVPPQVQAEETGPIPCPPNTLTKILDSVSGLETVNNPGAPVIGTDVESDAVFRSRIKASLNINSIAVISAIKANIEALPGVISSYCYDNYSTQQINIDDILVPAHSILAVVDGGVAEDIAKVLYNKKTLGTGYLASSTNPNITIETINVTDPAYGTDYTVKFARPDLVPLEIEATVSRQGYTGSNLEQDVINAIMTWASGDNAEVEGPKIGRSISPFELAAAISNSIPEIAIRQIQIAKVEGTLSTDIISMDAVQKATIAADNITVNITESI